MPSSPLMPHRVHSDTHIFTVAGSNGPGNSNMREPNLNVNQKLSIKTVADFKLRAGVKPIRRMDVSDASEVKQSYAVKIPSYHQESQALAIASNRNLPPHLLLASLLEELCFIYVKDRDKAQHLFKILCERLSKLQVMAPLSHLDEMSGLRYQRRTMLNKLMRAAMRSMEQGPSLLALPDINFSLNLSRSGLMEADMIEQQSSRYKNEFQELGILGKGGFGSVFKARNFLDGREYAVKKVRFKHKNTDLELKLLREVKALANLQHTNIVGYNAAWMEYDSPYLTGKERATINDQITQDSDSDTTDSVQFDYQDSMSVEFCLSDDKINSGVRGSAAVSIPGGLAMNAKLFSAVHKPDMARSPGSRAAGYLNSKHTRLNENHNRSSEEDSVVFVDSVRKHEGPQKSCKLELEQVCVQHGTSRSRVMRKEELDANYLSKDLRKLENNDSMHCYDEEFNISTEDYKGVSTKVFSRASLGNLHNVDERWLDNPSINSQFHNVDKSLLKNPSINPQFHNVDERLLDNPTANPLFHNVDERLLDNPNVNAQFHNVHETLFHNAIDNPHFHNVDESLLYNPTANPWFHNVDEILLDNLSSKPQYHNGDESLLDNPSAKPQYHNGDDSLLDNSSTIQQFRQVSVEHKHSNHYTTELLTSSDTSVLHKQTDSVGSVVDQETSCTVASLSLVDQTSILNTSQVRYHWCPEFAKLSDQNCQCSGVQLPPGFINMCQQAASSVVIDVQTEKNFLLHHHEDNVTLANLDLDSCVPVDRQHCVLKTSSQTQNLHLNSTPSSLLISENEISRNSESVISTLFQAAGASVIPKISLSQYNNRAIKANPHKTVFTKKQMKHGQILSYDSSQSQQVDTVHEIKHDLNFVMSHASSIDEPLSKASYTPSREEKFGSRQRRLGRKGHLKKVSFRNDSDSDTEDVKLQNNYVFQNSITLYIQMELCTFTLQEWLTQRNSDFHLKGYDDVALRSDNIRVFHQILQGVDFIHANGLIHRDLKPRNIFLSGSDLHVKIGDFGLATGDALKPGREDLVLTPLSSVTPLVFDNHTEGVGTSAYASPEQLNGSNYDFRSDMYSLGVMLYEMFHVFVTEMERVQEIQQLRRGNKCSSTFRKRWPLEADIVEALTNSTASIRPSAQDVLSSKLFLSHEQQVKNLQKKLLEQQKQLEKLKRELQEKDRIIAQLHREQREKTLAEEFDLFL